MSEGIQAHISALREEVERQYRERLSAISELEASLLGSSSTNGIGSTTPTVGMGANITKVRSALSTTEFRSIRELVKASGLDEFAVRNALKTRTLQPFIDKSTGEDGPMRIRLLTSPRVAPPRTKAGGVGSMVRDYLTAHPEGATSGEMAVYIIPRMKSKSRNPKNRVQSTIAKMKKSGRLIHNAETGIYKLAKSK